MSALKIGGSPFRPASGVSGGKKTEAKAETNGASPSRGTYDTTDLHPNRLAVMPRMSALGSQNAQQAQGSAVETLLKESAAEVDDYFSNAYGFEKK